MTKESAAEAVTEVSEKSNKADGGDADKEKAETKDRRQKLLHWLQQRVQKKSEEER